jgi:hypothetical protein
MISTSSDTVLHERPPSLQLLASALALGTPAPFGRNHGPGSVPVLCRQPHPIIPRIRPRAADVFQQRCRIQSDRYDD